MDKIEVDNYTKSHYVYMKIQDIQDDILLKIKEHNVFGKYSDEEFNIIIMTLKYDIEIYKKEFEILEKENSGEKLFSKEELKLKEIEKQCKIYWEETKEHKSFANFILVNISNIINK